MAKKVSNDDRKKIVAKFGGNTTEKKKKLKHPPKQKKEIVVANNQIHEEPCKKSLVPLNGKGHNLGLLKAKVHVPKKIKIVQVPPIHVGQSIL